MNSFSPLTPLASDHLDAWGFAKGTRVWMANGSYKTVEQIEKGDHVFGITWQKEDDYLPIAGATGRPEDNIVKVWRPILTARKVLDIAIIKARPWQLTFGDHEEQQDTRRLVAGGYTAINVFPFYHEENHAKSLVRCHTSVQNPRVQTETRAGQELDTEATSQAGRPVYRPTALTNTPRGELALIVPYEIYGGQLKMISGDIRRYNRYLFAQMREIVPLQKPTSLWQFKLQADTKEVNAASEDNPRCNMIAQTPFAPEKKKSRVALDNQHFQFPNADLSMTNPEVFKQKWEAWAKEMKESQGKEENSAEIEQQEVSVQGQFYESQRPEIAQDLKKSYNIEGGWLNGGILITVPST